MKANPLCGFEPHELPESFNPNEMEDMLFNQYDEYGRIIKHGATILEVIADKEYIETGYILPLGRENGGSINSQKILKNLKGITKYYANSEERIHNDQRKRNQHKKKIEEPNPTVSSTIKNKRKPIF